MSKYRKEVSYAIISNDHVTIDEYRNVLGFSYIQTATCNTPKAI